MKSQLLTYNKSIRKLLNDPINLKFPCFYISLEGRERDRDRYIYRERDRQIDRERERERERERRERERDMLLIAFLV